MPAERDPQQGMTFIYSNFYQLYRQGKLQAKNPSPDLAKGIVLQPVEVKTLNPSTTSDFKKWSHHEDEVKKNLVSHVRSLRETRKRLTFLMAEVDAILKRG